MTLADIEKACASVEGVVFDFGGVISESPLTDEWAVYPYCEKLGVDRAAVDRGWARYRNIFDGGLISFAEYYERTFADAGAKVTPEQIEDLWELDSVSWVRNLRGDTLALMRRLKSAGKKIGVLSNMSNEFYERLYMARCAEYRAPLQALQAGGADIPPCREQNGACPRATDVLGRYRGERRGRAFLRLAFRSLS